MREPSRPEPEAREAPSPDVRHLALLARLELSPDEREALSRDLARIIGACDKIAELDLEGVEPTTFCVPLENVFREGPPAPSLDREAVLDQAPARSAEGFRVPPVLEGGES